MSYLKTRSVVITGAAIGSPVGFNLEENYAAWWRGGNFFRPISSYNTIGSSVLYAGECPPIDIGILPDKKVKKLLTKKDLISLVTSLRATNTAGIKPGTLDPQRFGMYVGAGSTQIGDLAPYFPLVTACVNDGVFDSKRFGREFQHLINPLFFLQTLMNNALCFGTMTQQIHGVNANFMDFQISGLRAVGEAFRSITTGRADVVLAGGVSSPVDPFVMAEGVHGGYLAKTSDPEIIPERTAKPFDASRRGTILSEGAAYLILEEEEHARARGAQVLGRVLGYGFGSDGRIELQEIYEAKGLYHAMVLALEEAQESKDNGQIGAIIGHANGSRYGDGTEAVTYRRFLSAKNLDVAITSPKGCVGEMSEAAGVAAAILSLEILRRREVPPTFNFGEPDETSLALKISSLPQIFNHELTMVTSRSFVGHSCALVLGPA